MDKAITLKAGKKNVNVHQCDPFGRIRIIQDVPFPAEVLNILGRVAIGDEPKYGVELEPLPEFFINCLNPTPPLVCTDITPRGQQVLTLELAFNNQDSYPLPAAIVHSAYGLFVSDTGEFYSMTGNANCAGGNMAYVDGCVAVSHFTNFNSDVFDHPALVPPEDVFLPAVNVINGPSDEAMYAFAGGATVDVYYIDDNVHVQFTEIAPTSLNPRHFAKRGNRIYFNPVQSFGSGLNRNIFVFNDRVNTLVAQWNTLDDFFFESFYPTDDFLYVLTQEVAGYPNSPVAIKKLDLSDGSLTDSFDLSNISASCIYPVSDDLIYVLSNHDQGVIYYLENFTSLRFVGQISNPESINPGFSSLAFYNGKLYFGGNGRNIDVNNNIKTVEISCPTDVAIIATIDRVEDTIAAGDDLHVSWENIVQPDFFDEIGLYADVPGELGFENQLASVSTGATGSGSTTLTIPLATPPGTYFVALTADSGGVFIDKSDTFEVT